MWKEEKKKIYMEKTTVYMETARSDWVQYIFMSERD